MTDTLFNLTHGVARKLGALRDNIATGGSTTTLIDVDHLVEADEFWNEGTIWITRDAGGLGAAPEGEYSGIVDFTNATGLADLHETLTAAIAVGDRYSIATNRYPLHQLIAAVNEALLNMGTVPLVDKTLSGSSSNTEYDLPSVDINLDLRRVYEQRRTGAADDNQWVRRYDWHIEKQASGADKLIFDTAPEGSRLIKLEYQGIHAPLFVASDALNEKVHANRVIYLAALAMLEHRHQDPADEDPTLLGQIQRLDAQSQIAMVEHPIVSPQKNTKMLILRDVNRGRRYPGDREPR
jgi:hypothetical protein